MAKAKPKARRLAIDHPDFRAYEPQTVVRSHRQGLKLY